MKIYLITSGEEYSDYGIIGVWLNKTEAEQYLPYIKACRGWLPPGELKIILETDALALYKKTLPEGTSIDVTKIWFDKEARIEEFEIQGELPKLIEKLLDEEKKRQEDVMQELTAQAQKLGLGY